MPTYCIPMWFEFHGKVYIEAPSLEEAVRIAEEEDLPEPKDAYELHFTEGTELDSEGLALYNESILTEQDKKYLDIQD